MKKLILISSVLIFSLAAQLAHSAPMSYSSRGDNSLTGLLGFSQGAVTFGGNFVNQSSANMGVGGYFLYSAEQESNAGKNQLISFGAIAPLTLLDDSRLNVVLTPGFGLTMIKGLRGQDDQTVFGPLWKTAAFLKVSPTVQLGVETTHLVNWFSSKALSDAMLTNFAVKIAL